MHTQRGSAIQHREPSVGLAPGERVAALLVTAVAQAHLREILGGPSALAVHHCTRDHLAFLASDAVVLSVVEITEHTASAHVSAIRALREGFPSTPVLAYCEPAGGTSSAIVDAIRAGATGLVLRGIDNSRASFRDAIVRARRSVISERLFAELAPILSTDARLFLRYAIEHSAVDVSVDDAAHDLGVDRKTLTNWLARAGAPRAREFLSWVRLVVAAQLLSDPRRTAENVALALDFPSGTSLRNMIRRYVNLTTNELQQPGGLELVIAAFKRQVQHSTVRPLPTALPGDEGHETAVEERSARLEASA